MSSVIFLIGWFSWEILLRGGGGGGGSEVKEAITKSIGREKVSPQKVFLVTNCQKVVKDK